MCRFQSGPPIYWNCLGAVSPDFSCFSFFFFFFFFYFRCHAFDSLFLLYNVGPFFVNLFYDEVSYLFLQMSMQHQKPSRPSNKMKTAGSNEAGRKLPYKDLACSSGQSIRKRYDTEALQMTDS